MKEHTAEFKLADISKRNSLTSYNSEFVQVSTFNAYHVNAMYQLGYNTPAVFMCTLPSLLIIAPGSQQSADVMELL